MGKNSCSCLCHKTEEYVDSHSEMCLLYCVVPNESATLQQESLDKQLRYLETWGMAYMYLTVTAFALLAIGLAIKVVSL